MMENRALVRSAGLLTLIGIALGFGISIARVVTYPDMMRAASGGFVPLEILVTISFAALAIGLVGLARSDAAGEGRPAQIGLVLAWLGLGLVLLTQTILIIQDEYPVTLGIVAGLLIGLGMLLTGSAVLGARRWGGWRRYAPLLIGLYPLVMVFTFPILEGIIAPENLAALEQGLTAVNFLFWLPLGFALWLPAGERPATRPGLTG